MFALSSQLEALAQSIDVQPQQPQKTGQQNQPQTQKSKTAGLKQHSGRDYSIHGLETALIVSAKVSIQVSKTFKKTVALFDTR